MRAPLAPDPRPLSDPDRWQRIAREGLAVALLALGLWTLRSFLPALAWAGILAIALWPLYAKVVRRFPPKGHNILLPALFTGAVALVFVLPLILAAVQAGRESQELLSWVGGVQRNGLPAPDFLNAVPFGGSVTAWWHENLEGSTAFRDLFRRFGVGGSFYGFTREFGTQLIRRVVIFAFTLMALFFLFRDGQSVVEQLLVASNRLFGPRGERVGRQMIASVHGTVDGLVLVGLAEGVVLGIAYAIAGVPHPTLLGGLTGIAAIIPFGAPVVFAVAALLLLAQGSVVAAVVIVVVGFAVVMVADHVVRPVLIGGATRLPFLWVLFGILGGVESFGLLGLFLGPAVMAALILLWRDFATPPAVAERAKHPILGTGR